MRKGRSPGHPAEIPCAAQVVFRDNVYDDGLVLVIDVYYIVALARPVILVLPDAERDSEEVTRAARFGEDIILFAVRILQPVRVAVVLPVVVGRRVGRRLIVRGMQVERVVGERRHALKINVGVERADRQRAFVGDGHTRRPAVRHRQVAVQSANSGTVEECRLVYEVLAQVQAEEVAERRLDARMLFVVPPGAQYQLLQVILALRGDSEPDVRNHAGAFLVIDLLRLARRDGPAVAVAAGQVVARLLERAIILAARVPGEEVIAWRLAPLLRLSGRRRRRKSRRDRRSAEHGEVLEEGATRPVNPISVHGLSPKSPQRTQRL